MGDFEQYCMEVLTCFILEKTEDVGEFDCWKFIGKEGDFEKKTLADGTSLKYGILSKSIKRGNEKKYFSKVRVHRIVKLHELGLTEDPRPCSHLCHESTCVNPNHIELEYTATNNQRRTCKLSGKCNQHFDSEGFRLPSCFF